MEELIQMSRKELNRIRVIEAVKQKQYDSPFNYAEQSLLVVPTDMPNPTHPQFTNAAIEKILMAVLASRGNAFVLFTSYSMLKYCFNVLQGRLLEHKLTPMKQARTEAILAKGGDPFMEYTIPNAIVKFKQGFGRLIRNKNDRGCIVCLDSRLVNKGYGKLFLNSLPPCQTLFADTAAAEKGMVDFYRKTYYLVKRT